MNHNLTGFDLSVLDQMIENAPDDARDSQETKISESMGICPTTGIPKRYRANWEHPSDEEWQGNFQVSLKTAKAGGIIALIGIRGGGKTRLAAEVVRKVSKDKADYVTAMDLFLRIRESFGKKSTESEREIVKDYAKAPILIIDELQERGGSEWEDRILTHIIDKRYGAMLPTIIIANLTEPALMQCLGESITSRLHETGGIIEISKISHRIK